MKNIEFKIKKLFRLRNELAKMNNDYKSSTPIKNVNIEINTSKFEQNTNQNPIIKVERNITIEI
jgi:hypothetical protein